MQYKYGIPVVVFLIVSFIVYKKKKDKADAKTKAVMYGAAVSVVTLAIIKFMPKMNKGTGEPMMPGTYFDAT